MTRTLAFATLVGLATLLASCSRYHSRAQGPFAAPRKDPPPPYGAVSPNHPANKPIANQSPLGIANADPTPPLKIDEPSLIPPKADGVQQAGGVDASGDPNAFPPFKKRPQPAPLPSPFAPKEPTPPAKEPEKKQGADAPRSPEAKQLAQIKELLATAGDAWKAVDTFEATLTRRELSAKGAASSEVMIFQFRRDPMSLYTRNIGGGGKGRETVYNPGKHDDKIHIKLGEGDHPLARAGYIAPPISPDDPKVTDKSRYSIRQSGFGRSYNALNAAVAKIEAGKAPADSLVYLGSVKREEYTYALVGVTHKLRPGDDPLMPTGGTRTYFFDMNKESQSFGMPVLVFAADPTGKEAEYYLFEKVKNPAKLTEADFNPARLKK